VPDGSPGIYDKRGHTPEVNRRVRRRWQLGLRTVFLLMAAIAAWLTYFVNRRHNAALAARINAIVPLAHELIVTDPKKITVVKLDEEWIDENRWDICLPDGNFRLCLATSGIDDNGLAPVVKNVPITPGTHRLFLAESRDKNPRQVRVLCDDKEAIAWAAPHDPKASRGATSVAGFAQSKQFSPDDPIVLLRRRFHKADGRGVSGASDGVLLWVERAPALRKTP
jgi:hypothetical protein